MNCHEQSWIEKNAHRFDIIEMEFIVQRARKRFLNNIVLSVVHSFRQCVNIQQMFELADGNAVCANERVHKSSRTVWITMYWFIPQEDNSVSEESTPPRLSSIRFRTDSPFIFFFLAFVKFENTICTFSKRIDESETMTRISRSLLLK